LQKRQAGSFRRLDKLARGLKPLRHEHATDSLQLKMSNRLGPFIRLQLAKEPNLALAYNLQSARVYVVGKARERQPKLLYARHGQAAL
jgi:hypothetical protein